MSSVRATFDPQQKYEDFVKDLNNSITLGEWEVTPDPISYNPGITVTITCEEEDVKQILGIISRHGGKQAP